MPEYLSIDEEKLAAAVAKNTFTGVVTIDIGDDRVFERAYGFAHRAHRVPVSVDTRFAIASGGKAFTALAVMRLVEDGLLGLGDRVRPVLGDDLPLIDDKVTVEHLLTHTSGIGDYLDEEADWDADDYVMPVPVHTLDHIEAFVPVLDGYPQSFPPGEKFTYCNGGYVVLAVVAERVAKRPYHELVETEVCARAGLVGTEFLRSDTLPADAAMGYLYAEGDHSNVLHLPVRGTGDGGIYTSAADLHRFWRAVTAGRIVSSETVATMIRPRHDVPAEDLRSGMGFFLHSTGPALVIEGYDAGVSFRSTHVAETATTVSVLGNSSEGAWPVMGVLA